MGITTTGDLGDTIPTILEEANFTSQFNAIMAGLSWNIQKGKGSTVNVPYWDDVTANNLIEGVDMSNAETMVDTKVTITPGEVGCKILYTDDSVEDDNEDIKRAAGTLLGYAVEYKRDYDLLLQLDDATTSLCGSAGVLTMGHIAAGRALLSGNGRTVGGPAPLPYVVVLHPFQTLDLVDVITPVLPAATYLNVTGTAFTDEIMKNYTIGKLFGMAVIEDGNIPIDSSSDAKGGVFAAGRKGGLILANARPMKIEPQRDASARGWELNCVARYGVGEYKAGWIVELYSNATTPS